MVGAVAGSRGIELTCYLCILGIFVLSEVFGLLLDIVFKFVGSSYHTVS